MTKELVNQNSSTPPVSLAGGKGTERNQKIDVIKGIAILLMVIGHTDSPIAHWIYLFHMAVFFIASGFCWNEKNSLDFVSLKRYVFKKIKSLYIPYVLCNSIYVLLNPFFVRCHLYSAESLIGFNEIIIQIGKAIFFGGEKGFAGATWFLRTLFFVTVGHALFVFITKRMRFKKYIQIAVLVLCVIVAQLIASYHISLPKGLSSCFAGYLAYFFGIWFRRYSANVRCLMKKYQSAIVLAVCVAILTSLNFICSISVRGGHIENVLLYAIASVSGWLLLWETAVLLPGRLLQMFKVAGQYSIYVVLFHFLAFKIVSAGYIFVSHKEILLLSSFPTIVGVPFLWIAYTIVGITVPVLMAVIVKSLKKFFIIRRTNV